MWDDSIDESVYLSDIDTTFSVYDSVLNFTSNNINSKFNLADKTGTININDDINLASDIDFEYKNNQLNAYFNNIIFPISLLNKIINVKLTKFYGDPFKGNILIEDILNKPKYYGEVSSTNFKIKTLYTQNNEISAPNISVILNEDEIYANRTKAIYFNEEENKYINFFVSSKIIMPNFDFDFFELDVLASDFIPVYIPLLGQNLTMLGEGKNNFNFSTDGNTSYIAGDLVVENGVIYSGVDLPSWIVSRQEVNGDLRIITAENNTFYYPYVDNPILKITMANNQKINVKFDSLTKTYSPTGNIDILQGEIFYFQKNFYINNGSLALNVNSNTKRLEPVVSLDATLREIDSNGDAVDINLSLENSTLYNLNPNFTSVPIKTQQEIMNILGQSFSTSANNETVASLASAATSVFSSLGYLETGGVASLNNTIANSLNLDFFSLKSNIVENLILQTFIEDPRYSSYSPLARYLNNTTIFMGKYLNNNSKFQILINLLANDDDDKTSFITSDLSLDLEMSYEVDTELAKFSFFTNPNQLSILEILDTIGFSVTKTIDFR